VQAANEHKAIVTAVMNATVFFIFLSPVYLIAVSVQNYYTTLIFRCQLSREVKTGQQRLFLNK
jgi:hypothetical protein